jgi:hypothetical protein
MTLRDMRLPIVGGSSLSASNKLHFGVDHKPRPMVVSFRFSATVNA